MSIPSPSDPGDIGPLLSIVMTFSLMHPVLPFPSSLSHFSAFLVVLPVMTIIINYIDSNSCVGSDPGEPILGIRLAVRDGRGD